MIELDGDEGPAFMPMPIDIPMAEVNGNGHCEPEEAGDSICPPVQPLPPFVPPNPHKHELLTFSGFRISGVEFIRRGRVMMAFVTVRASENFRKLTGIETITDMDVAVRDEQDQDDEGIAHRVSMYKTLSRIDRRARKLWEKAMVKRLNEKRFREKQQATSQHHKCRCDRAQQ